MREVTITFPADDLDSERPGIEAVRDQQRDSWFDLLFDEVMGENELFCQLN